MNQIRQLVLEGMEHVNIPYDITEHPAVYTIEEMDRGSRFGSGPPIIRTHRSSSQREYSHGLAASGRFGIDYSEPWQSDHLYHALIFQSTGQCGRVNASPLQFYGIRTVW